MKRTLWRIAAVLAFAPPAMAANGDAPGDYALRIPVTPAPGGGIQRLAVPARVLVASRAGGLADLRLFDAAGRALPIARGLPDAPRARRTVRLPALPILGKAGAPGLTGMSLEVEGGRVIAVAVKGEAVDASALLGVLFDTRGIEDPIERLTLDADLPRGQPVTLTIETSDDLSDWMPLATRTLYRAGAAGADAAFALDPDAAAGRYLRVTWDRARLVSPVAVRGAAARVVGAADPARLPRAVIGGATADGARAITFAVPFPTRIVALEIVAAGGDTVIPVRILGRDTAEQPWRPIAAGTVYRVTEGGRTRRNPAFPLAESPRSLRIEADARTAGFAAPPGIAVRFDPVSLLFLDGGAPPFTLAAGRAGAADVALPAPGLMPGYSPAKEAALPQAATPRAPDPIVQAEASPDGAPRRLLLWAILLGGTALLAAMVWRLLRQRPADEGVSPRP